MFSAIAPGVLFEITHTGAQQVPRLQSPVCVNEKGDATHSLECHYHGVSSVFASVSWNIDKPVNAHTQAARLADKRCGLIRADGFVMDPDNSMKIVQVVGSRCSVSDSPAAVKPGRWALLALTSYVKYMCFLVVVLTDCVET